MANFKKGVALVLAAATAFTFAPVSTLGTPVVAEAAAAVTVTVPVKDVATNGVVLTKTATPATLTSQKISLNDVAFISAAPTVESLNTDIATVSAIAEDATFTITGVSVGATDVVVKAGTNEVYKIHVSVREASKTAKVDGNSTVRVGDPIAATVSSEFNSAAAVATEVAKVSDTSFVDNAGKFAKPGSVTITYSYNKTGAAEANVEGNGTISKTYTVLPETATLTVEGKDTSKIADGTIVKVVELTKDNASYQISASIKDADEEQKIEYTTGKTSEQLKALGFTFDSKTGTVTANADAFKNKSELAVTVDASTGTVNAAVVKFKAVAETTKTTSLKVTADGQEKEAKATLKDDFSTAEDASATFDKVVLSTDDKQTLDLAIVATPDKAVITSDDKSVVEVNGTTLTAKKAGKANVTVKVASDVNYFGNATITIPVEVISGKANNAIVTNSVTLSKTVKTAKDYAKATVDKTVLSYRFVKYDAATKTYVADNPTDVTLDTVTGELKYITENAGSAIVEVTGKAPAGAADPKPAYVTVSFSNKKEASKLAVETKSLNVEAGKTAAIVATGTALTFASSDETIATVAADGTVTGVKTGVAIVTVTDAGDENTEGGSVDVPVYVKAKAAVVVAKPAKVTSLKVANVKGAKVKVSFKKSAKATGYLVTYKVGKKTVKKTTTKTALTLSVKKGAKVKVSVKAFNKNAAGAKQYSAAVSKTLKTDKK